jgi:hypothetical protein
VLPGGSCLQLDKEETVEAKVRDMREKLQVRWAMFLAVGGTTLAALVAGSGVILSGPGRP